MARMSASDHKPPGNTRGSESPVIPIDYPEGSPYAVTGNGNGNGVSAIPAPVSVGAVAPPTVN